MLENKRKKVYVEEGRVYDAHYRRLKRASLLDGDKAKVLQEVLLSCCGEVELLGDISFDDEFYLKEYFNHRIIFKRNGGGSKYLN